LQLLPDTLLSVERDDGFDTAGDEFAVLVPPVKAARGEKAEADRVKNAILPCSVIYKAC
jgi:hypothetical protein